MGSLGSLGGGLLPRRRLGRGRSEAEAGAEAEAEAEAGVAAGLAEVEAGREVSEGSAARDFRDGPLEQLRLELQAAHVT